MPTVGAPEILVFLLAAAALVFLAFRGRVPMFALVLLVVVLAPPVAISLAFLVGTVLGSFVPA